MNAFRFAVTAKKQGHEVNVFLLGEGVEAEQVINDNFYIKEQMGNFVATKSEMLA